MRKELSFGPECSTRPPLDLGKKTNVLQYLMFSHASEIDNM